MLQNYYMPEKLVYFYNLTLVSNCSVRTTPPALRTGLQVSAPVAVTGSANI